MKVLKRVISCGLCLLLAISFLSACKKEVPSSGANGNNGAQTDSSVKGDPITFSWFISESWFMNKWGEDPTSKYIMEKTGVNIDFIVPAGNNEEKLTMMIATNDIPDFVTIPQYSNAYIKIRDGGLVYPLNELADKYDKSFYDNTYKSSRQWFTHTDGNLYAYPATNTPLEAADDPQNIASSSSFMVRKDIYEALGKPDMRTPEGFLDALKRAKEMFPEVNGQSLIPFATNSFSERGCDGFEYLLADFLAAPIEKDGKLLDTLRYRTDDHVKWLKTFRKANEMGLLSKDIFVDKEAQISEKVSQGRYFAMLYDWRGIRQSLPILYKEHPEMIYIAVNGPSNSKLEPSKLRGGSLAGWVITMIGKKNKDPERAIKFMSYWLSEEGQKDFFMGAPGITRETVNGVDKIKDDVYDLRDTDQNEFAKKYGCRDIYWMLIDTPRTNKWLRPYAEPFKQLAEFPADKTVLIPEIENLEPAADTKEGIARAKIKEKWSRVLPQLLLAPSDEEFDKIIKGYWTDEDAAREIYGASLQKQYEINKAKIGK